MNMHVVHVVEAFSTGILTWLYTINNALADRDVTITIIHSMREETPEDYKILFSPKIRFIHFPMKVDANIISNIKTIYTLKRTILKLRPNIVHIHSSIAGYFARLALINKRKGICVIYQPHGLAMLRLDYPAWLRKIFLILENILGQLNNITVACGYTEFLVLRDKIGIKNAITINNGIDLLKYSKNINHISKGAVIATSGGIRYQKAPWAFSKIAKHFQHHQDVEFVWLGDGNNPEYTEDLKNAGVEISGWLDSDEIIKKLETTKIFIMTSLWEGLPISLLEAQAMGIPCIVSNVIGNKDIIVDKYTGFVADNPEVFIEKLKVLLNDDNLYQRFSNNSREHIIKHYDIKFTIDNIFKLYSGEVNCG